ncbi:MAG: hypothetical protein O3C40_37615 [Planctomycetota bacterium]|nr:hypothetical protein [Planctomycetota bacterium]
MSCLELNDVLEELEFLGMKFSQITKCGFMRFVMVRCGFHSVPVSYSNDLCFQLSSDPLRQPCREVSPFLMAAASGLPTADEDLAVASADEFFVSVEDPQQVGLLLQDATQLVLSFLEVFFR